MAPSKVQRWLDIIAYLVGRRLPVAVDELMRNVPAYAARWESDDPQQHESARRSFERDKDELRRLGIPIRTVKYSTMDASDVQEGYLIERRDFYLPYLRLVQDATGGSRYRDRHRIADVEISDADAPLALEALRRVSAVPGFPLAREARSAFRKLAFDLDPHLFGARSEVVFMEAPGSGELVGRLRALSDALLARKRVGFRYRGIRRGEETERSVDAYGLLFQGGHWYLVGRDELRSDVRVFRVGRMDDVAVNSRAPNTPDYAIPEDFDLREYAGRRAWELGESPEEAVTARIRFRFPLSLWADRNGYGEPESRATDGSSVRVFTVHQVDAFLRWLLTLEGEAEVVEPQSLRNALLELAHRVAKAHSEDVDD